MNKENLKKFAKNGKIVFDSSEDKGLSVRDVFNLAHAFGLWIKEKMVRDETNISLAVGTDTSSVSESIKDVFLKSFTNDGYLIFDAQRTYPPAIFRMTIMQNVTGCVFIYVTGKGSQTVCIDFMTRLGRISDEQLHEIIDLLTYSNKKIDLIVPEYRPDQNLKQFAEIARQRICQRINSTDFSRPLRGLKFVIDTNEGIGNYVVDKILLPLGAEVVEVKGSEPVAKHCKNVSANAGIIFDYNLHSFSLVSREFGVVSRDAYTYILTQLINAGENEEVTVLTDYKVSSKTARKASEKFRCNFEVCLDGGTDLIERQRYLNDNGVNCPIAIFKDGSCSYRDNYFFIDPVYTLFRLIMKIIALREEGKKLEDLINDYYQKEMEWYVANKSFDKAGYAQTVLTAVEGHCLKDSRWNTTSSENSVSCKNEDFRFSVINVDNDFFKIVINCDNPRLTYRILFEIYSYMKNFLSLNFDKIKCVF